MPKGLPDTAATAHYLHPSVLPYCSHITRTTSGPTVQVAKGNIIRPDLRATFKLSNKLSSKAQSADIFNDIITGSLISMGQLCDDGYVAIFTKFDLKILKHNRAIFTGFRDRTGGLWNTPLELNPSAQKSSRRYLPNQANVILRHDTTKHKLSQYFHVSAFSPINSTFIAAINNSHLMSWPSLCAEVIYKHLTQSSFTVKVHIDQEQKNLCSTQSHQDFLDNIHPKQKQCYHHIPAAIINVNSRTSKSYSDQTGRFLVLSSRGN